MQIDKASQEQNRPLPIHNSSNNSSKFNYLNLDKDHCLRLYRFNRLNNNSSYNNRNK